MTASPRNAPVVLDLSHRTASAGVGTGVSFYDPGSTGQTTFTKSDGTTGTVANTFLAYDNNGHAVSTTNSTDAAATVSVTSTGLNSDGSIAFVDTSTTSADGSAITNTFDHNGDGVIDHIQLITTSTDALGARTETITNSNGGHVLRDRIQTISSSDGTNVTINRDTTGGGWFNQREQRATSADGRRSNVVTQLNADVTEVTSSTTTVSADGFTQSLGTDLTSDGLADRIATDAIMINGDNSRSETKTATSANGTVLNGQVSSTSANGHHSNVMTQLNADGTEAMKRKMNNSSEFLQHAA